MTYTSLKISGLRGFSSEQELRLAVPDGQTAGSGLTMLVGPNNSGKSTVTEALRALGQSEPPSFTEGRRNQTSGDRIALKLFRDKTMIRSVRTVDSGGSETIIEVAEGELQPTIFSLPSRRQFNTYFGKSNLGRQQYLQSDQLPPNRLAVSDRTAYRLFNIEANREKFDALLGEVLSPVPKWTIDQSDQGQYYLKFQVGDRSHSSEGMGEGLVSLIVIIDALYDISDRDMIVIDEPELSLHPALQRNLFQVFRRLSAKHQIVVATHSPYFVDFQSLINGAELARVYRSEETSKIGAVTITTKAALRGLLADTHNPHLLGLDAREVFFLHDDVILVEGQDDARIYPMIASELCTIIPAQIYGWGVGGAGNMGTFSHLLKDLGFQKVFGILDGNKSQELPALKKLFPGFSFHCISTPDVRSKLAVPAQKEVQGLTDRSGTLLPEHVEEARKLFGTVAEYFAAENRVAN